MILVWKGFIAEAIWDVFVRFIGGCIWMLEFMDRVTFVRSRCCLAKKEFILVQMSNIELKFVMAWD